MHRYLAAALSLSLLIAGNVSARAAEPAVVASPAAAVATKVVTIPITYVSQLTEPAPGWWQYQGTPYCAAAAALMVMETFGVPFPTNPLTTTFGIGRQRNTTADLGLDPNGISYLMRHYGGEGTIHTYWDRALALHHLIGRMNHGAPVVALTQAGNHAVVVYGYEAVQDGPVTAIYVADPLSGFRGKVRVQDWTSQWGWFGSPFAAPGDAWRGGFVFVSYRDFRVAPAAAPAPAPAPAPVVRLPVHRSAWVSQSPWPQLSVGATSDVTIQIKNAGQTTWVKRTATEVRLGTKGDSRAAHGLGLTVDWPMPERPAVQMEDSVAPGQSATFTFTVRGGTRGVHRIDVRPVIDGVAWLDDQGIYVLVDVR